MNYFKILVVLAWFVATGQTAFSATLAVDNSQLVGNASQLGATSEEPTLKVVATYTDLEVQNSTNGAVFVQGRSEIGDGGMGVFSWLSGDHSKDISGDPLQGIFVAPTSDRSGRSGAWARQFSPRILDVKWFGATGLGRDKHEDVAINAAFSVGLSQSIPVYISAGVYKTSAPIFTRVPFSGADGLNTKIFPQGDFPAFDVYECSNGRIENIYVDFSDVGAKNINSDCIGFRLMHKAPSASVQIQNTTFSNLFIYRASSGIFYNYDGVKTIGQLWMVSIDHVSVVAPKEVGIFLNCSSGTLNVSINSYVMEGASGFDSWNWTSSQGIYLKNMVQVQINNASIARVQNSTYGMVANFQSIHGLDINGLQMEGVNITKAASPVYLATCDGVKIDMIVQTPTFSVIAPYLYFDANMKGVIVENINEIGVGGDRNAKRFIGCNALNPELRVRVVDPLIKRSLCQLDVSVKQNFVFVSDDYSVQ